MDQLNWNFASFLFSESRILLLLLLPLLLFLLLLVRLFTLPQSRTYTPTDLHSKCPGSEACRGDQLSLDQNTRQIHKGGPPWMCGQHNGRASAEDNTGQNTDKGHTPNPRTEIKIPDPAVNRTGAAGLKGRDSTDHATATDNLEYAVLKSYNSSNKYGNFKIQQNSFPVSTQCQSYRQR